MLWLFFVALITFALDAFVPRANHTLILTQDAPANTLIQVFDKYQFSTTVPSSLWVVVNKQNPLQPKSYEPNDLVVPNVSLKLPGNESMQLRQYAASSIQEMFAAAKAQGLSLILSSGYRSYSYQTFLYDSYVKTDGQAVTDTQSARPGYSEHQTGLAVDIAPLSLYCDLDPCFGQTSEGIWLAANAYMYGFVIRYTLGNEDITGYDAEPWHLRYVGKELSSRLHNLGVNTLEQFFNVAGGKSY